MKEETNAEYLSVLAALGATIAKHKNDLSFARYDVERLQKKLDEANRELESMREGEDNVK